MCNCRQSFKTLNMKDSIGMMRKRKNSSGDDDVEIDSNLTSSSTSRRNSDRNRGRGRRAIAILAFLAMMLFLGFAYYKHPNTEDTDEISINLKKHNDLILKVDEEFQNKYTKIPRYLSFVRLDKPVYVAGDTVRARVVVLNEKTFMPYLPPKRGGKKDRRPFQPPLNCEMKIYGYVFFISLIHKLTQATMHTHVTLEPQTQRRRDRDVESRKTEGCNACHLVEQSVRSRWRIVSCSCKM